MHDLSFWQAILEQQGQPPDGTSVSELTPELLELLQSVDPVLRDEIAYPLFDTWIHSGRYSQDELRKLTELLGARLVDGIGSPESDTVFGRTFAALVLAELVAEDHSQRFLNRKQFQQLFACAIQNMTEERDLRGFVPEKGWAHAVAHAADLLWMLALHPATQAYEQKRILEAIAQRLHTTDDLVLLYGEDQRLATAAVAALGCLDDQVWATAWLKRLISRDGRDLGFGATTEPQGLAAYQNVRLFLVSLYFASAHPRGEGWEALPEWVNAQFIRPPEAAQTLVPLLLESLRRMQGI